jgi:hypothetical protein
MKRFTTATIFVFFVACFATTAGWAQNAHFLRFSGSLDSSGDYVASFKEAGLGNTPVTYSLTATTENFTFQCYTKSGNTPQGAPNSISFSNTTSFVTLTPRNGQITGSVSLAPEQGSADCQGGGLQLFLIAVDYEGVSLCDTTADPDVCKSLPSLSASNLHIRF